MDCRHGAEDAESEEWALSPFFVRALLRVELSFSTRKERLIKLLEPPINALGYELVDLEAHTSRNGLLRIFIDRESGIDLDDCEAVSHQISAVLDVEDPMPGQYSLEVSSPGSDRPLRTLEHFERFSDEMVRIKLRQALDGQQNFKGRLLGVEDQEVLLALDRGTVRLAHDEISSAHVLPEH